jgi:glucan phosphoethanolaminetransferase (alkaline phosphatase superfamily)
VLNFILAFVFGASWGYKSTAIFILMPALVILYPKINFKKISVFGVLAFTIFVLFAIFFDNTDNVDFNNVDLFASGSDGNPIQFVLYRITVLQGDVCWKVWDLFVDNKLSGVNYSKTIWGVIGDGNLNRLFGVNTSNYPEYIKYHFGLLLTLLCGNSPSSIAEGYNVTGTVFSEGLIAGGKTGLLFFSAFAGICAKITKSLIDSGLKNNLPLLASISSTYFCFNIFSWINGGGIETLFHISVLLGLILNIIFLTTIINISKKLKI